ncbi:MAG: DUF1192 domain-containing protein [Aestuariivirga sp.]|uniref:DUF1192 domain-containing protein n=1 Tax=Aestuariivirga sp. TaxID=2650926 RepID=UPI0025C193CB|nr:DUF1192 domain-containing protein [Aestuariivirga sp.]MCA3561237.1 DUF1192 domain-containing protein [Aestuariivirga sp.]
MSFEDPPKKPSGAMLGENLDLLSVAELEQRVRDLESEIQRVRAAITSKQASKNTADAFFRT